MASGVREAYLSVGGAAFGLAGASFFVNPFGIVSGLAIAAAITALLYPRRLDPEDLASIDGYTTPMVLAIVGGLIALFRLGLMAVDVSRFFGV